MVKTDQRFRNNETVLLGFVGFVEIEFAEKAINEKELTLFNQPLKLTFARGNTRRNQNQYFSKTRLHISGIGKLEEEDLCKMLGKCDLIWPKDAKNAKNPYVFAQFENEDEKKVVMDKLNGKKIDEENTLKLSPAYAQRFPPRVGGGSGDRRRKFAQEQQ